MDGMAKSRQGSVVFDATSHHRCGLHHAHVGFVPKYFVFSNDTDRVMVEWRDGNGAGLVHQDRANGTRTLEVTGGNHGVIVGVKNSDTALTSANSGTIPGRARCRCRRTRRSPSFWLPKPAAGRRWANRHQPRKGLLRGLFSFQELEHGNKDERFSAAY
jgi:hypothetical protein